MSEQLQRIWLDSDRRTRAARTIWTNRNFWSILSFDEPTIEIADKTTFLSCRDQVTLQSPGPCSEQEECDITIDLMNIRCSDNGTPADLSDDYNEFMVWISGNGISDCWTADNGTTGAYGRYTFYFPADGQQHPLVITDCYNQECQATITLQSTDPCPTEECQIYAEVTNVLCNDNGTSNDPTDDFNVFTVSLSGNAEASNCWTADNGESGLYGQHTFTYPADGQMHTVVITDCDSEDCQTILELQSTMPCSEGGDCQIAAVLLEKHCELNTMEDPEDDSTVFTILVTSTSQTICWTDGLGGSGTFSSGILRYSNMNQMEISSTSNLRLATMRPVQRLCQHRPSSNHVMFARQGLIC